MSWASSFELICDTCGKVFSKDESHERRRVNSCHTLRPSAYLGTKYAHFCDLVCSEEGDSREVLLAIAGAIE